MKVLGSWFGHYFAVTIIWMTLLPMSFAANNFIVVRLPHNVRVEIPKNWEALSNNQRTTINASTQALVEKSGVLDAYSGDMNFGANYYDDAGKSAAVMNIRYYPELDITQADARDANASDVRELDAELHRIIVKGTRTSGISILAWNGTRKQIINGIVAFVSEYKRSATNNNGNFIIRLVRVFNGAKSFTLTVSYREKEGYVLRPICDRIISSLRI